MSTLHVEPDELRKLSRLLEQDAQALFTAEWQFQKATANLEMAWQGGRSQDFLADLQAMQRALRERTEELYSYGLILLHQADRWDELDQNWQIQYRDVFTGPRSSGG